MKQFIAFLICLFAVSASNAETIEKSGIIYDLSYGSYGRAKVIGYKPGLKKIDIPAEIKYKKTVYRVDQIACKASDYEGLGKSLKSVSITTGYMLNVCAHAFADCRGLKKVTIKNADKVKGTSFSWDGTSYDLLYNGAFAGCSSLTEVNFEAKSAGDHNTLPGGMFNRCSSLEKITLPEDLTSIYGDVFKDCTSLESIVIPSTVGHLSSAFERCSSLKFISLPDKIKTIYSETFKNCTSLFSIDLPENLDEICYCAFEGCSSLYSVTIPDKVTKIARDAFAGCSQLQHVKISPSSQLELIDTQAFLDCSSLDTISLPATMKQISERAFKGATSLQRVNMAAPVHIIAENAFEGCPALTGLKVSELMREVDLGCEVEEYIEYNPTDSLLLAQRQYFEEQYSLACEGDGAAQYVMYECYKEGKGCARIESKAYEWLEQSYFNDYPQALYKIAWSDKYKSQKGEILMRAAEMGNEDACFQMAMETRSKGKIEASAMYYIMACDAAIASGKKPSHVYLESLNEMGVDYNVETKEITYIEPKETDLAKHSRERREQADKELQENKAKAMAFIEEKRAKAQQRREKWMRVLDVAAAMADAFNQGYQSAHTSTVNNYSTHSSSTASKRHASPSASSSGTTASASNKKIATANQVSSRNTQQRVYSDYASMLMKMYYGNSPWSLSDWNNYQAKMRQIRTDFANKGLWLTKNTRLLISKNEWEDKSPDGHR